MLKTADLDFHLPPDLIATTPAEPRDVARLLVVSRSNPSVLVHTTIRELYRFLRPADLMVLNATRVIPARFIGRRIGTGGSLPGLYLGPSTVPGERRWVVLIKGGHLRPGIEIALGDGAVQLTLLDRTDEEPGAWIVRVDGAPAHEPDQAILSRVGMTPLPPYILQARKSQGVDIPDSFDRERYQTVFAGDQAAVGGGPGSVAAPTAGLHLTPALLDQLASKGVHRAEVVLHVGTGTFKPVDTEFVEQHPIHSERCSMPSATVGAIRQARDSGRVVCIGTTAARCIETYAQLFEAGDPLPEWVDTKLLLTPGYRWRWVNCLLTNFHLPRSTLLAMVASLFDGGLDRLKEIYGVAIAERYRFFSYGDAMLVLE